MKDKEKDEMANEVANKVTKKIIYVVLAVVVILFSLKTCINVFITQKGVFSGVYADGLTAFNEKKYDEALVHFNKAIELEPDIADTYNFRALTYYKLSKYKEAISDFTVFIESNPIIIAEAYYWRGVSNYEIGNFQGALFDFNKAIEYEPDDERFYCARGFLYSLDWSNYNYKKAVEDLEKGCKLGSIDSCEMLKNLVKR